MVSKLMLFSPLNRILLLALIFFLAACDGALKEQENSFNSIEFTPHFNGEALQCNRDFVIDNYQWQFNQLQFFISSIEIKVNDTWLKPTLIISSYQTEEIALLGEYCADTNQENWQLVFNDIFEKASQIRFTLGLPFAVNHLNPLTQESPLNIPSMFWGWQKGHKFLRLEMTSANDSWLFHLGSVGCKASSPLRAPKQECLYPNRYTYKLPISRTNNKISVDLSALIQGIKLSAETSCQSSPENKSCQQIIKNLLRENGLFSQPAHYNKESF